jgi:hypothetical protein
MVFEHYYAWNGLGFWVKSLLFKVENLAFRAFVFGDWQLAVGSFATWLRNGGFG